MGFHMNRKSIAIGIVALILISSNIIFGGCTEEPKPKNGEPVLLADDSNSTSEKIESVVSGNNQFALDFYLELKDEEENIFFSPYSISVAMAMTYEGARDQTAYEMQSVMHFPENNETRRSGFAGLYNRINKQDKKYTLNTANALWAHHDYDFLEEYFDLIERYYMGTTTNLDFVNEPQKSRETINNWVEEKTNDKIKDLIPENFINELTRLVLTNAIYFKGDWVLQFDEKRTKEQNFRVDSETTVKVQMMSIKEEDFNYYETAEVQVLELPYDGEDLSMLILLPKEDSLDSLDTSLTLENLTKWRDNLQEREMDIYIPKFKFETKYFMKDTLTEMGMPTAFIPGEADLSGMDGTQNLFIDFVIHQGYIEVNEKGTEAAAATAVGVSLTCAPPSFVADHPFIFLIQDRETGNILFFGRVVDPTK